MGSFANTVFSILLGWLQGLIAMIWAALTSKGGDAFLQFIAHNWIYIAAFLCVIGVAADFVVYLFRWEPYKVWRTAWNQKKNRKQTKETAESIDAEPLPERTSLPEEKEMNGRETYGEDGREEPADLPEETDDLYRWREHESEEPEAEVPAEVTKAGYTVPADSPYRRPESRDDARNRRRRRIRINLLGDSDEEDYHYITPEPIVDHRDAYYAPVYPKNWNNGEADNEEADNGEKRE